MSQEKTVRKARRMPTAEQLRVWRAYIETAEALRARLARRLQDEASLSTADYEVLLTLSESASHRLRTSELAARVGWERSRLSHHLGRMEERGLIRREACPEDGRGAEVVLSDAGARAFRAGSIPHLLAVRELFFDAFASEQLAQLDVLTETLRGHLGLDDDGVGPSRA
ncbi:MAG TPA: MarR family transcriptional regulator [Pseudomonadales bacterium]|nr:MarR family transcriptional regulator [Pseudomonadales bacterium]